jgi:Multiubiquitin
MSTSAATPDTKSMKQLRIFINGDPYFAPEASMTGDQLLELAGLPATNQLFLDIPGQGDDRPIGANEEFELRSGMKFYDVPVGTFG